jgi:hypothetical protein
MPAAQVVKKNEVGALEAKSAIGAALRLGGGEKK